METTSIGTNAGHIWKLVDKTGSLYVDEILEETKLDSESLYKALGWLARENQIAFDNLDGKPNITIVY
jgi:hypothetical protein